MGKLIVLNGGSSVGKTTLIHAFQNLMYQNKQQDYWHFGTDCSFFMLQPCVLNPDMSIAAPVDKDYYYIDHQTKNGEPYPVFVCGKKIMDFIRARYRSIKHYLDLGYNIVADEVVWSDEYINIFIEEYTEHPIYFIKTFSSEQCSKAREATRADRPENFYLSSADYVHKNMAYDAELDLSKITPEAAARNLLTIIENLKEPAAIHQLKKT